MDIRLIPQEDIEQQRWDGCVHYASNGHIFGYKWYLDHIGKEWVGLVEGNYESVMPLILRERKKDREPDEIHRPELISSVGVFSVHVISQARINGFWNAIPDRYRLHSIRLHVGNPLPEISASLQHHTDSSHQLLLNEQYEYLRKQYAQEALEKLSKAEDAELIPANTMKPEKVAEFFQQHHPELAKDEQVFHGIQRVMYNALHRGIGFASGVTDRQGKLLAANFFTFTHGKIMSLAPAVSTEGKARGAMYYLYDLMIRTYATRPLMIDFNFHREGGLPEHLGARVMLAHRISAKSRLPRWLGRS